jgi:hypothetical protein
MEGTMGGMCSSLFNNENTFSTLIGKTERKSPLGEPSRRWEHNIKINLAEGSRHIMD